MFFCYQVTRETAELTIKLLLTLQPEHPLSPLGKHLTPQHQYNYNRNGREQINLFVRSCKGGEQNSLWIFVCLLGMLRKSDVLRHASSQSAMLPVLVETPPPCPRRNRRSWGRPAWYWGCQEGGGRGPRGPGAPREDSAGSVVFEAPSPGQGGRGRGRAG